VAARLAAAGALVALAAVVLWPFLTSLAWGAILAYVTWPAWRRLPGRERRPGLCAAVLTAAVAIGIGIPVALLLVALADEATAIVQRLFDPGGPGLRIPAALADNPLLRRGLSLVEAAGLFDASRAGEWLGRAGAEISGRLVGLAGGVLHNAFKFGVAMVSLYAFYLSGEHLADLGRRLAPLLFPGAPARFVESVGDAVSAVMFGLLGTAMTQGVLAGIGLAVAGVPSPVALGAATALLSVVPFGGGILTLSAAAWLAFEGRWLAALALALWSLLVVSSMDNVLRPLLISGRARIPFLLVFLGVLGGLAGFGLIGAFVGPVILSVLFALLVEFSRIPPPAAESRRETPA
jgi:predicted PurR-regulated permease PerM